MSGGTDCIIWNFVLNLGSDIPKVGVAVYVYFPLGYFPKDMRYWTAKSFRVFKKRNEALYSSQYINLFKFLIEVYPDVQMCPDVSAWIIHSLWVDCHPYRSYFSMIKCNENESKAYFNFTGNHRIVTKFTKKQYGHFRV